MADWEALNRSLAQSGKSAQLKRLADSQAGQRLAQTLDPGTVAAAERGDAAAISRLLREVLSSKEGQELAKSVEDLLK